MDDALAFIGRILCPSVLLVPYRHPVVLASSASASFLTVPVGVLHLLLFAVVYVHAVPHGACAVVCGIVHGVGSCQVHRPHPHVAIQHLPAALLPCAEGVEIVLSGSLCLSLECHGGCQGDKNKPLHTFLYVKCRYLLVFSRMRSCLSGICLHSVPLLALVCG